MVTHCANFSIRFEHRRPAPRAPAHGAHVGHPPDPGWFPLSCRPGHLARPAANGSGSFFANCIIMENQKMRKTLLAFALVATAAAGALAYQNPFDMLPETERPATFEERFGVWPSLAPVIAEDADDDNQL